MVRLIREDVNKNSLPGVVQDELERIKQETWGDGTYPEHFNNEVFVHDLENVDVIVKSFDFDKYDKLYRCFGIIDIRWKWDEETDTVGVKDRFEFYYDPTSDSIVGENDGNAGSNKCDIDWSVVTNGINGKLRNALSKTYRLVEDFVVGNAEEAYAYFIEDNKLAELIEEGFWVNEDGMIVIPRGTEFCWCFPKNDDGRWLNIKFLNVPELGNDNTNLWEDRYYNNDDWAYDIMNCAKPI